MRYIFLLCLSLAVCGTTLHAQRKQLSRAAVDSLRALKNTDNTVSALQFAIDKIDMGAMFETDSAKELKFFFKNISDDVVKISKVTTSCGCTAAHYSTDDIPAGAGGVITIIFNPQGRARQPEQAVGKACHYRQCGGSRSMGAVSGGHGAVAA